MTTDSLPQSQRAGAGNEPVPPVAGARMDGAPGQGRAGWLARALPAIVWLFAIVGVYFWAHKPFTGSMLRGLGASLWGVVVWLGVSALALALGRTLRRAWLPAAVAGPAGAALDAGLGLGALALAVLGLGLAGLLRLPLVLVLLLALALVARRAWAPLWRAFREGAWLPRPWGRLEGWLALYAGISLATTFILALAPDIAWDSHLYHLAGPRLYVAMGAVGHPADIPPLGFPQLTEMLYTLTLLLGSDRAAPLLHTTFGLLAIALTAAIARDLAGRRAAWFAGAILLSTPALLSLMARSYVEVAQLAYATAALFALLRWREARLAGETERDWLITLGLLLGLAGGVKYTAVSLAMAAGASLLWTGRRDGARAAARRLLAVAGPALLLVLPWLLKNLALTGNPTYPFFSANGLHWDAWRAWFFDRPGTGLWPTDWGRLLLAPLEASLIGAEGSASYDATIGPFVLLMAPLLALVWRALPTATRAASGHVALFFAVQYGLWLAGMTRSALALQSRFLLPAFGASAALGGVALAALPALRRPRLAVDWLARTVFALALALLLFDTVLHAVAVHPLPVLAGLESRQAYEARRLGPYAAAMIAVNALPAGARVQFLWEPRSYLCRVDCLPDAILDHFLHQTHWLGRDAETIAAGWRADGVSHVLFGQSGYRFILASAFDPVTARDEAVLAALQARHLEPVASFDDAYVLYRLR